MTDHPEFDLDCEHIVPAGLPARLAKMHVRYGSTEGKRCGECAHLKGYRQAATWYKCTLTRMSGSTATDWRKKWPACGLWEERT